MGKVARLFGVAAVLLGVAGALTSCGHTSDAVVVRVGKGTVSKANVNHWMKVLVAGDYRNDLGKPAPTGLVSDPPNYRACIGAASRLAPKRDPQTTASLCRKLYQAAKLQAVGFLTDVLWHTEDAKEHGEAARTSEIKRRLERLRAREWPAPGQLQRYLAEAHRTLADEYYLLKRNVLSEKLFERVQRQLKPGDKAAFARLSEEYLAKWTSRTSCDPGYVTSQCKQYKASDGNAPAPDPILEQLSGRKPS
jgi:hypothetical protein